MSLNEAQLRTITFGPGPAMVLAGPGSGKTTVITRRIQNLVEQYKVNPSQILVITFTRAAADEMQQRYEKLTGRGGDQVTFGTFHSVFFFILRNAYNYSSSQIIRAEQKRDIIRQLLRNESNETEDEAELITSVLAEIGVVKGDGIAVSDYVCGCCPNDLFRKLYDGYQDQLQRLRLIDFDDMLVQCRDLFLARKDILALWQQRFRYILIDEFQDINRLQYEVVRMLALPENNLFVVGDDDQSIYRFRGARPEIMLGFPKDYPDACTMALEVNYRSTPQIVDAAARLIGVNTSRYKKALKAAAADGPELHYAVFDTSTDENLQVLRDVAAYHAKGIPYNEMAVLFRTNNDPRAMVETMIRMNFSFHMKDVVPNLYEHWIAQDILTYMFIAAGSSKRGDYLRIINRPKRYIRRTELIDPIVDLDKLAKQYESKPWIAERVFRLKQDMARLSRMDPYAAVNYIRHGIGYEEYLVEYAEFRRVRPDELLEVLDELQEASRNFHSLEEWLAHIRSYTEELHENRNQDLEKDGIWITTMHASKGLEYRVVFIVDANEGVTPHRRALTPEEIEEERRLFYVAMTRAKSCLHLYWTKLRCGKNVPVSRFVEETFSKASRIKAYSHNGNVQDSSANTRKDKIPHQNHTSPSYKPSPAERGRDILKNGWHI